MEEVGQWLGDNFLCTQRNIVFTIFGTEDNATGFPVFASSEYNSCTSSVGAWGLVGLLAAPE